MPRPCVRAGPLESSSSLRLKGMRVSLMLGPDMPGNADQRSYPETVVLATCRSIRPARNAVSPAGAATGWVRWAVLAVAVVVLAVEASLVRDQLSKAWHSLVSTNPWWVLAAIAAAMLSMHSFAGSSEPYCVRRASP